MKTKVAKAELAQSDFYSSEDQGKIENSGKMEIEGEAGSDLVSEIKIEKEEIHVDFIKTEERDFVSPESMTGTGIEVKPKVDPDIIEEFKEFEQNSRNQRNKPTGVVKVEFVETPLRRCQYCFQKYFFTLEKKTVHEKSCSNLKNMVDEFAMSSAGKYVCTTCSTIYPDLESLDRHKSVAHRTFFKCSICSAMFRDKMKLIEHLREHVSCKRCQMKFVSHEKQQEHMRECDVNYDQRNTKVPTEDIQMSSNQSKNSENASVDAAKEDSLMPVVDKLVKLVKEETMITTENNLEVQLKSPSTPSLTCVFCLKVFPETAKITNPMKRHSTICQCCQAKQANVYRNFTIVDTNVKNLPSNPCKKIVETKSLDNNMKLWQNSKKALLTSQLKCQMCQEVFENINMLSKHTHDVHLTCKVCLKVFGTLSEKEEHVKSSKHRSEYEKHIRTAQVFETVNYTCLVCSKVFPDKEHLEQHTSLQTCCESQKSVNTNIQMSSNQSKNSGNSLVHAAKEDSLMCLVFKEETMIAKSNVVKGASVNEDVQISSNQSQTSATTSVKAAKEDSLKSVLVKVKTMIATGKTFKVQLTSPPTPSLTCVICSSVFPGTARIPNDMKSNLRPICHHCKTNFPSLSKRKEQEIVCRKFTIDTSVNDFSCNFCKRTFQKNTALSMHMKFCQSSPKKFLASQLKCQVCQEVFESIDILSKHTRSVHLTCKVCLKVFGTLSAINKHVKSKRCHEQVLRSERSEIKCTECMISFPSSSEYEKHIQTSHVFETVNYNCLVCSKVFPNKEQLEQHTSLQTCYESQKSANEDIQMSSNQSKISENASFLQFIAARPKDANEFDCIYCNKKYLNKGALYQHLNSRHRGFPYKYTDGIIRCRFCREVCDDFEILKKHVLEKHP